MDTHKTPLYSFCLRAPVRIDFQTPFTVYTIHASTLILFFPPLACVQLQEKACKSYVVPIGLSDDSTNFLFEYIDTHTHTKDIVITKLIVPYLFISENSTSASICVMVKCQCICKTCMVNWIYLLMMLCGLGRGIMSIDELVSVEICRCMACWL